MIKLLMRERHFNDRTAYIEQMVRDDWDKRATPQMQAELNALLAKESLPSKRQINSTARGHVAKLVKRARTISERAQAGERNGGKV